MRLDGATLVGVLALLVVSSIACGVFSDDDAADESVDYAEDCEYLTDVYYDCGYDFQNVAKGIAADECTENWDDFWDCAAKCREAATSCGNLHDCIEDDCDWDGGSGDVN
jgi:hypothetical protein